MSVRHGAVKHTLRYSMRVRYIEHVSKTWGGKASVEYVPVTYVCKVRYNELDVDHLADRLLRLL